MNSRRVYYGMLGLVGILVIGLIGGAYGVNVLLQAKSQKLVDLKLQSQVIAGQQAGLAKAKNEVATYSELNTIARTIVPQDKDQAKAVLEITNLAAQSNIPQISSITFPQSTLGGSATATTSTTTTTPAAAPTAAKTNLTQLTQVKGLNGVYQLQITIQQSPDNSVSYNDFLTFLSNLEQNRRTAQVSSISLKPDSKNSAKVGFTLILNEFIKTMKDVPKIIEKLSRIAATGKRYLPALFGMLLLLIYGFLAFRIQTLNSQEPTTLDVSQKSRTAQVPHVDPTVVNQLTSLKDNSVNVQTLFDQARGNPFQE